MFTCTKRKLSDDSDNAFENTDINKQFYVDRNNIYFYTDVNRETVIKFNSTLDALDKQGYANINIFIHSNGGDVYAGLSAMNHIKLCSTHVTTIVDGISASAATFMSIAGHKRQMYEWSEVLIHQIQTGTWGRYEDMKNDMENNTKLMGRLRKMYESYTKIPSKKLNELFTKEINMGSDECLKYGIIDEII